MNIKLQTNKVISLLANISPEQLHHILSPLAEETDLTLPPTKIGYGYYQWTLDGEDWVPFSNLNDTQKAIVAEIYQERIKRIKTHLTGSPMQDFALRVPSEEYIFIRNKNDNKGYDIALVAYGYRFPHKAPLVSLDTWVKQTEKESVKIAFTWDNTLLTNFPFLLENENRITNKDGWFVCDGELPTGTSYNICTLNKTCFDLIVEKGKQEYVYDLTKNANISVQIRLDGQPIAGATCKISFRGKTQEITTDNHGTAQLKIALEGGYNGDIVEPQPPCEVTYNNDTQIKIPELGTTFYLFDHITEEPIVPIQNTPPINKKEPVKQEERKVCFTLLDYEGFPLTEMPFTIKTKRKGTIKLVTDNKGKCEILKEWFTANEKIKVCFDISPEYQNSHNIHNTKKRKK